MNRPARSRRIIALVAAYVVALQALLLPLSVAAGSPFSAGLCAFSAEGPPARHDTGCPCAAACGMACCAQVLGAPPPVVAGLALSDVRATEAVPAFAPVVRPAVTGPKLARAPPAA